MGKKNTKGTQKVNPVLDVSIASPPYETASGMSNTEEVKRGKHDKQVDLHSCKCVKKPVKKLKKKRKRTRTWESIQNLYGDADTTEVWDNQDQKPKAMFGSKLYKPEKPKEVIEESENNDVIMYPTSKFKDKLAKLSLLSLYRKRKIKDNTVKSDHLNENTKEIDVQSLPYTEPKLRLMSKKNAKKGLQDRYATGDICTEGPCREALEKLYNLQGLKYTPETNVLFEKKKAVKAGKKEQNKKERNKAKSPAKENKTVKKSNKKQIEAIKTNGNVGYGDQISPTAFKEQDLKDIQCKRSFVEKIMRHTICKCKNNNESKLRNPSKYKNNTEDTPQTSSKDVLCTCKNNKEGILPTSDTICKCYNNNELTLHASRKHTLSKIKNKIEKTLQTSSNHAICKCRNKKEGTLPTSNKNLMSIFKNKNEHALSIKKNKIEKPLQTSSNPAICRCKNEKEGTLPTSNKNFMSKFKNKNEHALSIKNKIENPLQTPNIHLICKCKKNTNERPLKTPSNRHTGDFLEMKVNSTDMRVINSSEVNEKIRRLGRIEKNMSCICPSRRKRMKGDRFCEDGVCENALRNKYTHFNCKCQNHYRENNIECKDSTCDLKIKSKARKKKRSRSPKYSKNNQPLLEVMLDSKKMNIINSEEIEDIIRKTSQNNIICPTGICKTMSKKKNVHLECKCVGKKLVPFMNECEERTCRNGVMINLPRGRRPGRGTYAGGRLPHARNKGSLEKKNKQLKDKTTKPKKKKSRRRRRRGFFRRKKKDHRTLWEKILDCLEKEEEQCEKRVKKKTKEYTKNEKKAIKENAKMVKEQKKIYTNQLHHWNCFTNFISGVLNIGFESVKMAFKITFSVIGDPLSSGIYIKEKSKNPPAAIMRIYEWFVRTWHNKSTIMSKKVEESSTLNVLSDQIEDSALYDAIYAPTGKSREEKMRYERRAKIRKRRMQKRQDEALYGCRHMLLTTMRKTPCLWFYHICPEMYPQCLGLVAFMNNFIHILLYLVAIMCWTPCIVFCEMCRAFMCCFFCTH